MNRKLLILKAILFLSFQTIQKIHNGVEMLTSNWNLWWKVDKFIDMNKRREFQEEQEILHVQGRKEIPSLALTKTGYWQPMSLIFSSSIKQYSGRDHICLGERSCILWEDLASVHLKHRQLKVCFKNVKIFVKILKFLLILLSFCFVLFFIKTMRASPRKEYACL